MMASEPQVIDVPDAHRYELLLDDTRVGLLRYSDRDGVRNLTHTQVDSAHQGKGLAAVLVRGALDDIRAQGLTAQPTCPYVQRFLQRHPEYADLITLVR